MGDETKKISKEAGISLRAPNEFVERTADNSDDVSSSSLSSQVIAAGVGVALFVNVGFLLSLPPVLRGKGAPFVPTFQKNLNAMFAQLRKEPNFVRRQQQGGKLCFVDLGSGDGRVVVRAAREELFHKCLGYEINPFLHAMAQGRRLFLPHLWSKTSFYLGDLWKADLAKADVVAVYGLGPIMKDLSVKLKDEMKPGSYVLSNVFTFPGWTALESSSEGTHIYRIPEQRASDQSQSH